MLNTIFFVIDELCKNTLLLLHSITLSAVHRYTSGALHSAHSPFNFRLLLPCQTQPEMNNQYVLLLLASNVCVLPFLFVYTPEHSSCHNDMIVHIGAMQEERRGAFDMISPSFYTFSLSISFSSCARPV